MIAPLGATHVSFVPESGWPLPSPLWASLDEEASMLSTQGNIVEATEAVRSFNLREGKGDIVSQNQVLGKMGRITRGSGPLLPGA